MSLPSTPRPPTHTVEVETNQFENGKIEAHTSPDGCAGKDCGSGEATAALQICGQKPISAPRHGKIVFCPAYEMGKIFKHVQCNQMGLGRLELGRPPKLVYPTA